MAIPGRRALDARVDRRGAGLVRGRRRNRSADGPGLRGGPLRPEPGRLGGDRRRRLDPPGNPDAERRRRVGTGQGDRRDARRAGRRRVRRAGARRSPGPVLALDRRRAVGRRPRRSRVRRRRGRRDRARSPAAMSRWAISGPASGARDRSPGARTTASRGGGSTTRRSPAAWPTPSRRTPTARSSRSARTSTSGRPSSGGRRTAARPGSGRRARTRGCTSRTRSG